jgi:hypothetical protein
MSNIPIFILEILISKLGFETGCPIRGYTRPL